MLLRYVTNARVPRSRLSLSLSLSVGHWFKLTERQYVDLTDFGITEEMQKPAAH